MMNDIKKLSIWTDGAYSPIRNIGGWAFYCPDYHLTVCGNKEKTTNNQMELMGVIKALEFFIGINISNTEITIFSDSLYVVNTMKGLYISKSNPILWNTIYHNLSILRKSNVSVNFVHVKGHSDNENNNITDMFANMLSQL